MNQDSVKTEEERCLIDRKQRDDIETIFKIYDTAGSNSVDLTELLATLGESLRNIMKAEIAAIFAKFDTDGNADLELEGS